MVYISSGVNSLYSWFRKGNESRNADIQTVNKAPLAHHFENQSCCSLSSFQAAHVVMKLFEYWNIYVSWNSLLSVPSLFSSLWLLLLCTDSFA